MSTPPNPSVACLDPRNLGNPFPHLPAEVWQIIASLTPDNTVFSLRLVGGECRLPLCNITRCDDRNFDCQKASRSISTLELKSYRSFLNSFVQICEKRPTDITIREYDDSFAKRNDIPWERLLHREAAAAAFKCVTKATNGSRQINFLCFAISSGSLGSLMRLCLHANYIGDAGMTELSRAIASGSLGGLRMLNLSKNQIRDAGMTALADAISSGSLGNLTHLWLEQNQIGDGGMTELYRAVVSGSLGKLKTLVLHNNKIGDAGMTALADAIASRLLGNLLELRLGANQIGDAGMSALAGAIASGSLGNLTRLYLYENKIGDEGMKAFAEAIASGYLPGLVTVVVDTKHERQPQLVAACEARGIRIA